MKESDSDDKPLQPWMCGARNRAGKFCRKAALKNGSGRCSLHGGKSVPPGPGHHSFRTGKYSRGFAGAVPRRLREQFEQAMSDPRLLELRHYVGLYESRVIDSMRRFEACDTGDFRGKLSELWSQFKTTNADKDIPKPEKAARITELFSQLDALITNGAAEGEGWQEVVDAMRLRMNATALEQKLGMERGQFFDVIEAAKLVFDLNRIVQELVPDQQVKNEIGRRLRIIMGGPEAVLSDAKKKQLSQLDAEGRLATTTSVDVVDVKAVPPLSDSAPAIGVDSAADAIDADDACM